MSLSLLFAASSSLLAQQPQPNSLDLIEEVRVALTEQFTSIHSIDAKFQVVSTVLDPRTKMPGDTRVEWRWCLSNRKRMIATTGNTEGPVGLPQTWISNDGQQSYEVDFWRTKPEWANRIKLTSNLSQHYAIAARPESLYGLSFFGQEGVLDWLRRPSHTIQYQGTETIQGVECRKIEFHDLTIGGQQGLNVGLVCFDSTADWLPRRVEIIPRRWKEMASQQPTEGKTKKTAINAVIQPGEVLFQLEVAEFFQIPDPLLHRSRWFPKRSAPLNGITAGNSARALSTVVVLDSVTVNSPISDQAFTPQSQIGTAIEDLRPGHAYTETVVGGDEGIAFRAKQMELEFPDNARGTISTSLTPPPDASQPTSRWSYWFAASALALIVLSLIRWIPARNT